MDEPRLREAAGASYDRGHSKAGVARQMYAITASGDRTKALHNLRLPTTVIHGAEDPLIHPSGGRATAKAIPGARLRIIEGMGHDLPRALWSTFTEEISSNTTRAMGELDKFERTTQASGPTSSSSLATSVVRET